jgi:tetratricopeptide (TPR) repeat protein
MQLVELLISNGKNQDAINELRGVTSEGHFDPHGLYNAGNALARLGDTEGAIAAYHKAIEQRKGRYSRALNNLGVVLLRQGRWDEAHEALMSALRLEGFRYAEASYNLGRLYASRGETDLAVREWRRALVVNPDHKAAAQALSSAGYQGQISVASAVKPPAYSKKSPAYDKPAVSMPKPVRQPAESLTVRPTKATPSPAPNKALTVDPETYSYLQRARTARDRDRQEEAVTNYKRVLSRMNGYFAPANLELSYSLINLKRLDEAIAVLIPVTERDGQRYPISYYHLARLYEGRGDLQQAEESFSRAATYYRKDNAQFLLDVSRVREKLGDLQGALNVLEEYVATIEAKNQKPDWSTERLTSLKQRIAAAQKP